MPSLRVVRLLILAIATAATGLCAAGSADVLERIERLRNTGRVLMIAAHPDDENTALLAYCARGRKLQTAYLSLTRGEGGQNLIGSEQGIMLGVIRTEELLAARRLDGARQYFTRAIDFGFSKTAEETMRFWGKDEVLADVVWVVRKFRPDVIILRFSGTPRDGHGHHQASAMIGKDAFHAAADASRFADQLKDAAVWKARRVMWNGFSFTREQEREMSSAPKAVRVDTGEYDPLLGMSYGELASLSRSQHRSQGFGTGPRRGSQMNALFTVDGEAAVNDFMDGVDTTWGRFEGGKTVADALDEALAAFEPRAPENSLPGLLKARRAMAAMQAAEAKERLAELDEAIAAAAGIHFEASTSRGMTTPGGEVEVTLTAIARGKTPVSLKGATVGGTAVAAGTLGVNQILTAKQKVAAPARTSQPYWLREPASAGMFKVADRRMLGEPANAPAIEARAVFAVEGVEFELARPVEHVWVDRSKGEEREPLEVLPAVAVELDGTAMVFPDAQPKEVSLNLASMSRDIGGTVRLEPPEGWSAAPDTQRFDISTTGQSTVKFTVTPPRGESRGVVRAVAQTTSGRADGGLVRLTYDHITPRTIAVPAEAAVIRQDFKVLSKRIGYIMGAGDQIPRALEQMGCEVTMLEKADLEKGDLSRFDAIVTGVRAFNVREDLRRASSRLWEYARQGGTVVVQYNVMDGQFWSNEAGTLTSLGPYPVQLSRDRVTVEEAPVKAVLPDHALLNAPNKIVAADWDGWVQERGLYFAGKWDEKYETPIEMNDPGERPSRGSLLTVRVGKGAYVMSGLSFFRQLPAGVPGAYKLFANMISAGKTP
ncbi:MAG: PIG-L family deacetylase [Bryobacteraceae bacterium]|nr:PIG-L family deacetylase [Bryobacteraceae bacterium]